MARTGRDGPDTTVVAAARDGDRRALDALVADSLPLVYNIVGRALNGHADVDDVVQETLLRVVRALPALREPESYRSWLIAIAVRQVRDRERDRRAALDRRADLDAVAEVQDPAADFAGVTILRLGLTDQRREVAEATRWLDSGDRSLLALWWLEETGELRRSDLAGALGLSGRHAAVRVQRMKEQLDTARTVVRALAADPGCPALAAAARDWNGVPGPLWRKRFARHVRGCAECEPRGRGLLPVDRLLGGLPLLPVPAGFALDRLIAAVHRGPAPRPSVAAPHGPGGSPVVRAGRHVPRPRLPLAGSVAVTGVAAVVVGGAAVTGHLSAPPAERLTARSAPAVSHTPSARPASAPKRHSSASSAHRLPATPSRTPAPTSGRKGVGVWKMPGVGTALARSRASWYYTWGAGHDGVVTPKGVRFVPMIWGPASVTRDNLARARSAGPYLLGFNEPDMAAQANMTVEKALALWPKLMAAGRVIGSPAVAYGADTPGGWLDRFMSGAAKRGYRVDFVALHWYGGDFRTEVAVGRLKSYLQAVYRRYHKPIWLTEYAMIDFSHGTRFPTETRQAAFVTASTKMLATLPYVHRYAWFGLPATGSRPNSGLFRDDGTPTPAGRAFQAAP
ncbi:sigma-70 family RNA polymerase sigma factor [Microbispora sp. ATCC PTA-5024]|uniref:sigma-70 family RNA polymerase sigma factor n=1 Tax=Microbispora sp. ATCC PTA-5024 TaxID=316330 RepID=UPI0003DC7AF7|nr:sigma-70 family RNA polymerase sigma factor [Microbispora sp. ATCC PTA-5024]ETK36000.1 glycosyl hydrolase [Microbispora sp. ATCC PTA-5024]